jgi:8-oxo-dGTP pyrophosphatase MutT (NUDIX family)
MNFDSLIPLLTERLSRPLPGSTVHEPMRAMPLGPLRPTFSHKLPPKPGSVLILLYPSGDSVKFPLTKRAEYLGTHGGQISFPGGKAESGEDKVMTALRECQEEIGVEPAKIEVIGKLSDFFVIPSNFMVTPVVGICRTKPAFTADPVEVVRILEGDLSELILDDAVKEKEILVAKQYRMLAPHFEIDGEIVWGATAMMLNELRTIVRECLMFNV